MTKKQVSPRVVSRKPGTARGHRNGNGNVNVNQGKSKVSDLVIDRQQAESALQDAETRYRTLVEQLPAIIYVDSAEHRGVSLYVSPQLKTMLGYDPQEWLPDTTLWTKMIHPEDREQVMAEYDRTIKSGEPFRVEYRVTSRDDRIIWIRDEATLIQDQFGHPLFWHGIMFDITERKQAEVALGESEERYRSLFDLSPDAIAVHSDGKILLANKTALNLIGAKNLNEVVGKPMLDFVHPDYRKLVLERTRRQIANGKIVPVVEEKFIRLDGTVVDVEVTAAPVHAQDTLASLAIFRDITERKRAQALQEAVYRIAIATETTISLNDLYPKIHEIISSVMPAENFYITLYDEERNTLRFPYFKDALDEPYLSEIQPGQGLTAYVLRMGKSLLCTQAVHDELERQGAVKLLGVPSAIWLGVPLIIEGKTIGAMVVQHYSDSKAYSEREQHMLEFVSSQVAIAISRKKAEDDLRLRTREAETLREATAVVASTLDREDAVRLMLDQFKHLFTFDTASVLLFGELGQPDFVAGMNYANEEVTSQAAHELLKDSPILKQMAQDLKPLTIADVREHPGWIWVPGAEHVRSFLAVPLIVHQRMIGALMADSVSPGFFSEGEVRVAQLLAQQMAIALENARLYQAALQAAERRAILHRVSQDMVTAIQEPEQTYQSIHQATRQLMPCDSFVIALHNETSGDNTIVYALEGDHRFPVHQVPAGRGLTGKVMASGESVIIDDLLADKTDVIRIGEPQPIRSLVAVPLRLGQNTTGMISAQSYKIHAFGPEEQALLEMLASYAAVAIENARLYQEAIRASERRSILHEVSQEIVKVGLDLERVYEAVHHAAERLMPAEAFALSVLDELHNEILYAYLYDEGKRWPSGSSPIGTGLSGRIIESGKALIINDLQTTPLPDGKDFGEGELVRSILAVPLRLGTKVFGMLSVQSYHPYSYTADDQALLEMLGAHTAVAIENARLYMETRHRLTELEAVNRISTALRVAQTAEQMLPLLLDETLKILNSDSGVIWLYNEDSSILEQVEARGWFTQVHEAPVSPNDGIAGMVFASGNPIISGEFASDDRTRAATRRQIPPGWGGACAPIRTGSEIIGVLFVSVQLPRQMNRGDVDLLTTITEIAGNAIHRSRLYEQSQRHLQRLASLRAIDMAISTVLDLRVTLNILIDHILSQLKVDAVDVLLYNPNTQMLHHGASAGFRTDSIRKWQSYVSEGLAGQVVRTRTTIHIPDLAADSSFTRLAMLSNEGFVTYFGVPLLAKGQVKGILEIFQRSRLAPDIEWKNFLETLAGQAAIAIDNASLFEELQKTNIDLSLAYDATIEGWSRALDLRDQQTEGHTQRVAELTVRLAQKLGVSDFDQVNIRRGALLHDIGKMGVPDEILHKTGPLSREDWQIMHRHPEFAYEMLYPISYLRSALDIPYCHHERWDGSGYPRKLKEEQIPLAARIFSVVDVWDALISDRPYRLAWTEKRALNFIQKNSGVRFDPKIVKAYLHMLGQE